MIRKQLLLLVGSLVLFSQCSTSNSMKFNDGKCYGKVLIPYQTAQAYEEYAVYTGDETQENVELEIKTIVVQEKSKNWVKKKADRNCMAPDPDDCLVWCLVETPRKEETLTLLVDTTQSKNFELKKIYKNTNPDPTVKGTTEWKEVVCEKDVTASLISQIQTALRSKLIYNNEVNGKFDAVTKQAIRDFQIKNNLPQGQLDLESLKALGIEI